jgi:hypothetical protein
LPPTILAVAEGIGQKTCEYEMKKFALGDVVNSDKGRRGVVRAAYRSKEGQQFYAVEKDGAMDYLEEDRLSPAPRVELAA